MRPIWSRLKGEDSKKKKDNVVAKTAKSTLKKIIAKFLSKALLKILLYIAVGLIGVGALSWALDILIDNKKWRI